LTPYELWIGLRYTRAKRRNHFISFISGVSMAGIGLGVMALIVVLSVMNGFQEELRARILGVAAHMEISGPAGTLGDWPGLAGLVAKHPEVRGSAPFVSGQGLLAVGSDTKGTMIRGILPGREDQVAEFSRQMQSGTLAELTPGGFNIVLGLDLARSLGVFVGDKVTLIVPQGVITPAGMLPRMKQFNVVGIFRVGMYEYDAGMALLNIEDAAKLYRLGTGVSGLRVKLADMERAPWVTRELAKSLPDGFYITDWSRDHTNFFRAIKMEKTVMFMILSLIVAVAAFNLVSSLVMLVTDKQADIAILRTLGLTPRSVMGCSWCRGR
jgi:lipoprotein-releasing system permease protein